MIFWGIVLALVALVLFLARRKDRKHKVTINRRDPAAENDIGNAALYEHGNPPDVPGGGF